MSQTERDRLKVLQSVRDGQRALGQAARLLDLSCRQVRRLLRRLEAEGDGALVHGLRGQPSNRRLTPELRPQVLDTYRQRFAGFGPTFACEKLAELDLVVSPDTLRRWLIAEGLWQRRRRREPQRSRRPRRACFGGLVQIDASLHDGLEGRGDDLVLVTMIDDATSRLLARFYRSGTVQAHLDLVGRWLERFGRPKALYSDRHSRFEPQDKGRAVADAETPFGRASRELDIALIRAHSPQAKGRVDRRFGTAQDRWVKELRRAGARPLDEANAVLDRLLPAHNRRFAKPARDSADAHRRLGRPFHLAAILSLQEQRVVSNDYTIRFRNRLYQLLKPISPGERGGRVIIEERLDGSLAIRVGEHDLKYEEVTSRAGLGGSAPKPPEVSALAADARGEEQDRTSGAEARSPGVPPAGGRSGRTPAEPYPPDSGGEETRPKRSGPGKDQPWRKPFKRPQ